MAALLLLLGCARLAAATTPESAYRFGCFPICRRSPSTSIFGPLAAGFAQGLERPVQLRTKSTFELFMKEVAAESYDIILVHPFFYVDAADNSHYLPLARVDDDLTAVVLVREDRPWDDWEDLAGHRLALPPAQAAVSRMVDVALRQHGLTPGIDVTLQSPRHQDVMHPCGAAWHRGCLRRAGLHRVPFGGGRRDEAPRDRGGAADQAFRAGRARARGAGGPRDPAAQPARPAGHRRRQSLPGGHGLAVLRRRAGPRL